MAPCGDALSIFDRVVSFQEKNLTRQAVTENLNVLDYSFYFEVTEMLMANDIPKYLKLFMMPFWLKALTDNTLSLG